MAANTRVYVGPNDRLPISTKLTSPTCAPGSTQYIHGVINIANSGNPYATIHAKQWEQGDVIVCGISYDSGPSSVTLSFPGKPKVTASPDPNVVYWLAPEYTSLWFLSVYFGYIGCVHQIDVPLGFPTGTVQVSRWAGFIPATQPIADSSIIWQDSESYTFTVLNSADRLPEFTCSNARFVPNPGIIGETSWLLVDYQSNIPAPYMPCVISGFPMDEVNRDEEESLFSSIRHPPGATWWNTAGGGLCCNCQGHPIPPPNGCSGQETWTSLVGMANRGWISTVGGKNRTMCIFCMNMPNSI